MDTATVSGATIGRKEHQMDTTMMTLLTLAIALAAFALGRRWGD